MTFRKDNANQIAAASPNNRNHDVRSFNMMTVVLTPLFLPRENWSFVAPKATALFAETLGVIVLFAGYVSSFV